MSIGSLILPSRFWNKILNAQSIPPCPGKKVIEDFIKAARAAGQTGVADDAQEWLNSHPNANVRFTLIDGADWSSYNDKGTLVILIPKWAWAKPPSCHQPRPNASRPAEPDPQGIPDLTHPEEIDREARNENSGTTTSTNLLLRH
ncbi:MAG: hypothetical protein HYY62_00240 [Deltaproteobacteria bacterium]|nr:hypothetical protein [Deltaproteobacteria bacterium]